MKKVQDPVIELMKVMVGLNHKLPFYRNGKPCFEPYRNHYGVTPGTEEAEILMRLEIDGLAVCTWSTKYNRDYYLTRKGLDWLGEQIGIYITEIRR